MPLIEDKMHKFIKVIGLCLILFTGNLSYAKKGHLVFGITPWSTPENLHQWFKPLMKHIESELGIKTTFIVGQSYESMKNYLQRGAVDIVFFSSQSYVRAKAELPKIKYLVTTLRRTNKENTSPYYHGVIIALKKSKIDKLQDLKGKSFGFVSPGSTSGFIYPNDLLLKNKINYNTDFKKVYWLKKHWRITGSIAMESIDAGTTMDINLVNARKQYGDIYKVVAKTDKIPNDAIVASPKTSTKTVKSLIKIFLNLKAEKYPLNEMIYRGFPFVGFKEINDSFYDPIRELQ